MSDSYQLSSRSNADNLNVILGEVAGESGIGYAPIEPIETFKVLFVEDVEEDENRELNLSAIDHAYTVESIFWSNFQGNVFSTDLRITIENADGNTLGRIEIPAEELDIGVSFALKKYPLANDDRIIIRPEFDIDRLTFIIKPCILLGQPINIG